MGRDTLKKRKNLLRWAKRRAKDQQAPFNLILDDIVVPDKCPVLGIPIKTGEGSLIDNSPTLDRIIPDLGYVSGNVIVISNKANRLKSNALWSEMKKLSTFFETYIQAKWMPQHTEET